MSEEQLPLIPLNKCLRCGNEYDDPVPPVTHPDGIMEIASKLWCGDCNALTMSIIYRNSSAYRILLIKGSNVHRKDNAS